MNMLKCSRIRLLLVWFCGLVLGIIAGFEAAIYSLVSHGVIKP